MTDWWIKGITKEIRKAEKEAFGKPMTIFTEKELSKYIKPNTTNNYLFETEEIDGKTYYIKQ